MINKETYKTINKYETISERLLKIELEDWTEENGNKITLIIAYGPNEDDKATNKDEFWNALADITENSNGKIFILGDLNGRVGKRDNTYNKVLGPYGEDIRNNNGKRILEFCQVQDFLVTNSFFQHKDTNKYTREVISRKEKSIIDYILVQRENRRLITDVKVNKEAEIFSDHYLLAAKVKTLNRTDRCKYTDKLKQTPTKNVTIKYYKLRDTQIQDKYKEHITREFNKITIENKNLEEAWTTFKNIILRATENICGTTRINNNKKQTAWWNQNIRSEISVKKQIWKNYLRDKNTDTYRKYKEQRKKVKQLVLDAKRQSWEEFGNNIEQNYKNNQKLFYKVIKNAKKNKIHTMNIKNKQGKVLHTKDDILERWKEYFEDLLKTNTTTAINIGPYNTQTQANEQIEETISEEEVKEALKSLKTGKAPGHDRITPDMLKYLSEEGIKAMHYILEKAWKEKQIPQDWETGVITPIFKKGDRKDCGNYRGLTLLSTALKIYEKILVSKLNKVIKNQLSDAQSGFRNGYSAQDHIFTLQQIIRKIKDQQKEVYIVFIDIEKAFDRVQRDEIWKSINIRGINNHLIAAIKSIYNRCTNYVRMHNTKSSTFTTQDGLRQGGVLSPTLFIILMDEVLKQCDKKTKKLHVGYNKLKPSCISECMFADDIALLASNEDDLKHNLEVWNEQLQKKVLR